MRATVADVDLDALLHNYARVRDRAQGADVIAVVKDDAYGHGVEAVAGTLASAGVEMLAVFTLEEALLLRAGGIRVPILVFIGVSDRSEADAAVRMQLTPVLWDLPAARLLDDAAAASNTTVNVHFKVDTGLTRLGAPLDEAVERYRSIRALKHVRIDGVMTHLATADEDDVSQDRQQLARFADVLAAIGDPPRLVHAANSAGVGAFGAIPGCNAIRPGIALYGIEPSRERPLGVRPVLSWSSKVRRVARAKKGTGVSYGHEYRLPKDGAIATVPVGYGDGLPRSLGGRGHVLVHGSRAPIAGRVAMDLIMVDVTEDQFEVGEGDEVVLIGSMGKLRQTADDLAEASGTIAYEIVCGIRRRVPRRYHRDGKLVAQRTLAGGYVTL